MRLKIVGHIPEITITIDFSDNVEAFQNLGYIGELRQRWGEIKKLNNTNHTISLVAKI